MVTSAFSSGLIGDPSQDWNMDGYGGHNVDPVNYVNSMSTLKNGKNGTCNTPTAPLAIAGYSSDFQAGDTDSSFNSQNKNASSSMHSTNNTNNYKNGKKGNYGAPTAPPATAGYRSDFQSGDITPSATANNATTTRNTTYMHTGKDILAAKNANKGKSNASTTSPAYPAYSRSFQSGDVDSSFTHNTDTLHNTSTNGENNANSTNTTRNSKKGQYNQPTAAPASARNPMGFQSGQVDSTFTATNDTKYSKNMNNTNNISNTKNGKKENYPSSTTRPSAASYSSAFEPDGIDSSFAHNTGTTHNTSTNNTSATTNGKKGNYQSSTTRPATATYSSELQSSKLDSRPTPNTTYATNNTNAMNTVNTTKNGKKSNYQSPTSRPSIAAYPGAYQPSGVGADSNLIAAAWEEHVDVATNRSFFYNNITKRSTWGQPSGMVKRAPPPPPSPPPMAPIVQKREQDQWFRIRDSRGRKIWYNEITMRSQVERPDCLRKYR